MISWQQRINNALKKRKVTNALRSRVLIENSTGRFLIYKGKRYWNFSSNDYLGLSHHSAIVQAWQKGADCYGVGSGSSGHVSGYTAAHHRFEEELADWLGYQRALLFISGFAANQAVIFALMTKKDRLIADKLSHASLIEAANLSQARLERFHHNDLQSLFSLLQKPHSVDGQLLIVTEGIFSMDGDSAPLSELHLAAQRADGWLMVDDAHGFGVIDSSGRGSCFNQQVKPELLVVTFGKGAGVSGAAVLCSKDVADYLLQCAQHLIYSTSMPPAQAVALLASLNIIRSGEGKERRQKLAQHVYQFRQGMDALRMNVLQSNHAIQPLIIGSNTNTLNLVQRLRKQNIWTVAIRPPTVPQNTARIRLTLSAAHETTDILALLEALHNAN